MGEPISVQWFDEHPEEWQRRLEELAAFGVPGAEAGRQFGEALREIQRLLTEPVDPQVADDIRDLGR